MSDQDKLHMQPPERLKNPQLAQEYYNERYKHGYMQEWPRYKLGRVEAFIRKLNLPEVGIALDFGCGSGVFTEMLRRALPQWEVHGTDVSTEALNVAALRVPNCQFYKLEENKSVMARYDVVFSHHVMEHVPDVKKTSVVVEAMLRSRATMIHILPCGDPGSFEYYVSKSRVDGIDAKHEGRFFFEEEGHLRRLTTEAITSLWRPFGFVIRKACYADHFFGAVKWITETNLDWILAFADPKKYPRIKDRTMMFLIRTLLSALWLTRGPIQVISRKWRYGCRTYRDYAVLVFCVCVFPISVSIDVIVRVLAWTEWKVSCDKPGGSEMYISFERK